jgi:hypothetical protein
VATDQGHLPCHRRQHPRTQNSELAIPQYDAALAAGERNLFHDLERRGQRLDEHSLLVRDFRRHFAQVRDR